MWWGHGMARGLVVRPGSEPPRSAPQAENVLRLLDYSFALSPSLTARRHTIRVENGGTSLTR